jgi:hypothetical protein
MFCAREATQIPLEFRCNRASGYEISPEDLRNLFDVGLINPLVAVGDGLLILMGRCFQINLVIVMGPLLQNSVTPTERPLGLAALRSHLVKFPIPFHKITDAHINRRIGSETHFPLQIIHVGTCCRDIAFLHGEKVLFCSGVGPQQAFELTTQTLKKGLILALNTHFLTPKRGL